MILCFSYNYHYFQHFFLNSHITIFSHEKDLSYYDFVHLLCSLDKTCRLSWGFLQHFVHQGYALVIYPIPYFTCALALGLCGTPCAVACVLL